MHTIHFGSSVYSTLACSSVKPSSEVFASSLEPLCLKNLLHSYKQIKVNDHDRLFAPYPKMYIQKYCTCPSRLLFCLVRQVFHIGFKKTASSLKWEQTFSQMVVQVSRCFIFYMLPYNFYLSGPYSTFWMPSFHILAKSLSERLILPYF